MLEHPDSFKSVLGGVGKLCLPSSKRKRENIKDELPGLQPVFLASVVKQLRGIQLFLRGFRHPLWADAHCYCRKPVLRHQGRQCLEARPVAFQVYRIDDWSAGNLLYSSFYNLGIGRVDDQWRVYLKTQALHQPCHEFELIRPLSGCHAHVKAVRPIFYLCPCKAHQPVKIVSKDELLCPPRPLGIKALAYY